MLEMEEGLEERCSLGPHQSMIIPPSSVTLNHEGWRGRRRQAVQYSCMCYAHTHSNASNNFCLYLHKHVSIYTYHSHSYTIPLSQIHVYMYIPFSLIHYTTFTNTCIYVHTILTHTLYHFHKYMYICTYRLVVKEIVPPAISEWRPLVVMANPRSGGNDGPKVLGAFRTLLNPVQVRTLTIR